MIVRGRQIDHRIVFERLEPEPEPFLNVIFLIHSLIDDDRTVGWKRSSDSESLLRGYCATIEADFDPEVRAALGFETGSKLDEDFEPFIVSRFNVAHFAVITVLCPSVVQSGRID